LIGALEIDGNSNEIVLLKTEAKKHAIRSIEIHHPLTIDFICVTHSQNTSFSTISEFLQNSRLGSRRSFHEN
jgi:hypothetical protein